ncbi:uncharacterized protein LOC124149277 isoform X2 [Haliotis rufescens]|uniref:uncharacterized protein LOC124149277 isoform X2 n=1 Tax=Haliotis rufescens TaxID=6454 RepID=UPI00201E8558|nr:uncharacterized protein LOC124149277 isoform X2 [Haliotis rufescens]
MLVQRSLILFTVYLLEVDSRCPAGQREHPLDGGRRCCSPLTTNDPCRPGNEIKPCLENGQSDRCLRCRKGLVQLDNTTSEFPVSCYLSLQECPPESVPHSTMSTKGCHLPCRCDEENGYTGDNPCNCVKAKECRANTYLKNGYCQGCPDGTHRPGLGFGPCKPLPTTSDSKPPAEELSTTEKTPSTSISGSRTSDVEETTPTSSPRPAPDTNPVVTAVGVVGSILIIVIIVILIVCCCCQRQRSISNRIYKSKVYIYIKNTFTQVNSSEPEAGLGNPPSYDDISLREGSLQEGTGNETEEGQGQREDERDSESLLFNPPSLFTGSSNQRSRPDQTDSTERKTICPSGIPGQGQSEGERDSENQLFNPPPLFTGSSDQSSVPPLSHRQTDSTERKTPHPSNMPGQRAMGLPDCPDL